MRAARLLMLVFLLGGLLAACGGGDSDSSDDDPTATRSGSTNATAATGSPTATRASSGASPTTGSGSASPTAGQAKPTATRAASSPTAAVTRTAPVRPIATKTQPAQPTSSSGGSGDLELVEQGYSYLPDYDEIAWGFVVENGNSSEAILLSEYRVIVYDAAGSVLETSEGYIDVVMPGAQYGLGGSLFIPEGSEADHMEVQVEAGDTGDPEIDATLTVDAESIRYFEGTLFPSVTALITSDFERPLQDVLVTAVLLDAAGEIIGGGYSYQPIIPSNGTTGFEVMVASAEEPDSVIVYATYSSLTVYSDELALDDSSGGESLVLQEFGFGPTDYDTEYGYGLIIENPNAGLAIEDIVYQVVAYDADGSVLRTTSSYVQLLMPGERLGLGDSFYVPDDTVAAQMEVLVLGRTFTETDLPSGFLTTSDVVFVADDFAPSVTGVVHNALGVNLEDIEAYAIAYDADGNIIGGGYTFVDFVPAGGTAVAEIDIAVSGEPAHVEMFATPSSLTELE